MPHPWVMQSPRGTAPAGSPAPGPAAGRVPAAARRQQAGSSIPRARGSLWPRVVPGGCGELREGWLLELCPGLLSLCPVCFN